MQHRDFRDVKLASAYPGVNRLEMECRQKALVGSIKTGCAGIGYFRQHLIQEEVQASMEQGGASVGIGKQGAWTK